MISDRKIRQRLVELLPSNYRKVVSKRAGCHPNTVYNVLHDEHENAKVEFEILVLAKEEKERRDAVARKIKKLTKKIINELRHL